MSARKCVKIYRQGLRINRDRDVFTSIHLLINAKSQCYDSVYKNFYRNPEHKDFFKTYLSRKLYSNDWSYKNYLLGYYGEFCKMPSHKYYYEVGNESVTNWRYREFI